MRLSEKEKQVIIACLEEMRDEGVLYKTVGICFNLKYSIGSKISIDAYDLVTELSEDWPGNSGRSNYPIEQPDASGIDRNIWEGEALEKRKDLINHMINHLV